MEGMTPEGMSSQAERIWGMLDDMANNDPQAYRRFIDKQLKEGKELMKPPEPHMCVQVIIMSKPTRTLFINFCSWQRIPAPKTPEDAVPVTGTSLSQEEDNKGPFSLISVAMNPNVLEQFGRNCKNQIDADTLIQLAIDYVENEQNIKVSRTYTVLPEDTLYKGELQFIQISLSNKLGKKDEHFEDDIKRLEKQFGPMKDDEKDSLMSKLSNIAVSDTKQNKGNVGFTSATNGQHPIQLTPMHKEPHKKGLIEEIKDGSHTSNSAKRKFPAPKYTLEPCENDGLRCLELRVELPGVKSVSECELDISEDDVQLIVPDIYELKVKLPSTVNDDRAQAKFRKKTSVLTLIMPVRK